MLWVANDSMGWVKWLIKMANYDAPFKTTIGSFLAQSGRVI
jgi:hypothetical protein